MATRASRSQTRAAGPVVGAPATIAASSAMLAPAAPRAAGGLLAASPAGIIGWAWIPSSPEQVVDVVLLAGEAVLGRVRADDFGLQLVRKRVGSGVPGFAFRPAFAPPGPYPMQIALRTEAGEVLGESLQISGPEQLDVHIGPGPDACIEGVLDGFNIGQLTGWAWNSAAASHVVSVELYDGGRFLSRSLADQYRQDLQDAGKRDGACGFALELPVTLLDGRTHSLHVRVAGHGIELQGSPLSIGQLHISALTDELTNLRAQLSDLAERVERCVAPDGRLQGGLVRTLSERIAAFGDIQREMVTREMEALRALYRRQTPGDSTARLVP